MLILATVFLIRFVVALQLPDLPMSVPAGYLAISGAVWGLTAAVAGLGLLLGKPWSVRMVRWGIPAFLLWYWIDRLLFARSDYAARSWPFALILSTVGLGWYILALRRQSFRKYFEENNV